MKKNLIITALAVFVILSNNGICQAKTDTDTAKSAASIKAEVNTSSETVSTDKDKLPPDFSKEKNLGEMLPPPDFDGNHHPIFEGKQPPSNFHHPSKEEMDKKKAEFEERLNLTDKQKKKIEANRIKDREKIKPVFDEMKAKQQELEKIRTDETLSRSDKMQKENQLKKEMGALRQKMKSAHEKNMKSFESILTKKQKKEFAQIKKEQRKEMGMRKKAFEKSMHHPDMPPPFLPPQPPKEN